MNNIQIKKNKKKLNQTNKKKIINKIYNIIQKKMNLYKLISFPISISPNQLFLKMNSI